MGVRDALLLNTTGSNFQALQTNDTARVKGDLSLQKDDGTEVLGIDVSAATLNLTGGITGSGNISSSLSSTGSFGRVVATTFHGDGSALKSTLPRSVGIVTQSAQLAAQISGAFTSGFEMSASISGSATSTGSFGRVEGEFFFGDGSGIKTTLPRSTGILSSSAQIASNISGSFNKGFEYEGIIKGSVATAGGTWSTGGALSLSITYHGVAGDKSGAISAMGVRGSWPTGYFAVPGGINTDCNEEYNGSTWSEANNNTTARARVAAAGGVNAGLFFGGVTTPWYGASSAATETYNGTNWSEVNDMIIPRRAHLGSGTQNAALAIGGYKDGNHNPTDNPAATSTMDCNVEQWNGTNWSNNGQAPAIMKRGAAAGSVNTTLVFGTSTNKTETYEWNGSSWSEGGAHPSRQDVGGGGSSNDAISFGSYPASSEAATYDGSTWSETGDTIVSNGFTGMGANQQAASTAISVGGQSPGPAGVACTEEYTGGTAIISASFGRLEATTITGNATGLHSTLPYSGVISGSAQLATSISGSFNKGFEFSGEISGSADSTGSFARLNFISASGDGSSLRDQIFPGVISSSAQLASNISGSFNKGFEFDGQIKVAAGGVFSTGASLGRTVRFLSGLGSVNAAHAIAGNAINTPQAVSEEYDGSSWSEGGELPAANTLGGTSGTVNAGLYFGGFPQGDETFTYNGSSFSETTDLPGSSGAGTVGAGSNQGSALAMIGTSANQLNDAYEWNGSNWSEITAIINNRGRNQGGGESSEAALVVGGDDTPTCVKTNQTEIWNGSNWSVVASTSHARRYGAFAGTTNDGIVMGDLNNTGVVEVWDGTTWTETSALISSAGGHGTAASGRVGIGTLAGGAHKFGGGVFSTPASELFSAFENSGSFGRIVAEVFHGDATGLHSTLPYPTGMISASKQIASQISGSFNKGFGFSGEISGSATSTGSFGIVEAGFLHGDGSSIKDSLSRSTGLLSSSAQIAADISGSFNKGFGYEGTIQTSPGGTWSAGGNLTRTAYLQTGNIAGTGTKSAALFVGGRSNCETEEYDGTSFTQRNDLSEVKDATQMTGTTEAALVFGGSTTYDFAQSTVNTEEWNGTNWSEVNNLIQARCKHGKLGITSEAAKAIAGVYLGAPGGSTGVEDWNGSNWSGGTAVPAPNMYAVASAGTYDSGIIMGFPGTETYCWNGSSWSDVATRAIHRYNRSGGAGTSNDAFIAGGQSPSPSPVQYSDCVELYDGSAWSSGPDLPAGRNSMGAADSLNTGAGAGMIAGGIGGTSPNYCVSSLEYSNNIGSASFHNVSVTNLTGDGSPFSASLQSQLLTSVTQISNSISGSFQGGFDLQGGVSASFGLQGGGTWRSGGTLNNSGYWGVAVGHENAALQIGGNGRTQKTEEYNGLVWTEVTDTINSHGTGGDLGAVGTTEGSVLATSAGVEIWNGSNWSEAVATYPVSSTGHGSAGVSQNAGLFFNGGSTDEWNGVSFTEAGSNMGNSRSYMASSGQSTEAAIAAGGSTNAGNVAPGMYTEIYNGTSWTEVADLISGRQMGEGAGHTNYFLMIGGSHSNSNLTDGNVEIFNGTSWSVTGNLITHVRVNTATGGNSDILGGCGALTIGGASPGGGSTKTEHFVTSTSGSFHHLRGTVGGEIKTDMFNLSGSTMKIPLFSDADLNYISREPEEGTGSMSGSVDRDAIVNVLDRPGSFFFHSDHNALGFTYVSSSVYSQSIDFVTCAYTSGGLYTSSTGFTTQSHYCYHNVVQYITGSYT